VICCLVFVAFLVFLVAAGGYGLIHGQPHLLLTPWDYDGNGCGYDAPTLEYPYLYFPTINTDAAQAAAKNPTSASVADILKYGTCVKECPKATGVVDCRAPTFMKTDPNAYKDCVFYAGATSLSPGVAVRYETAKLARFCAPAGAALEDQALSAFKTAFSQYFGKYNIQSYLSDIVSAREILAWALLSGFLIGFVYMIFMRLFGGPLVYFSILGLILGTAYGGFMVYQTWQGMDPTHPHYQYYEYGAYTIWGIAALLLCCTLCNWNNIKIGVAVMKCTAQYIGNNPQVFLVPPLACVVILAWLAVWTYFAAHIVSIGTLKANGVLSTVVWSDETRYVFLYSLFGYLWLNAFIIGVTQFIISASAALWYFTSSGDSNGKGSLCKGLYWVFRYHLGSIAFGAFLIALVQFIRIIFEYYKRQLEKAGKENKVVKILLCLTSYLLDCLERFIKFISKNAYIQVSKFLVLI
jgi:choline transporter-like protein 2/4/5